jgi:hypothetical protein
MREKHNFTETSRRFRTSRLDENKRCGADAPVRTMDEEKNKRRPLLSALEVLTGAKRRILLCVDTGEARNPWWVSHPDLSLLPHAFSPPVGAI